MTSQTYDTDNAQLVQEHEQPVPENNMMEPEAALSVAEPEHAEAEAALTVAEPEHAEAEADLAEPETDLAEPETDLAEPETDLAGPHADQIGHEDPTSDPTGTVALAEDESAAFTGSGYPGFTRDGDDSAGEHGMADGSPESPSLVSEAFTVTGPATESRLASNTAAEHGPWNEIQAMFVDDPRGSIDRAARLVDDRVEALIQSLTGTAAFHAVAVAIR